METLEQIFGYVCGQIHLCMVGGEAVPLCDRCVGLYAGAAVAVVLAWLRPRATVRMLWVHGIFMLVMLPFGYHLIEQGAVVRIVTGQLFAYGLTYYLLLLPLPDRFARTGWRCNVAYFTAQFVGIILLLSLVANGGHRAALLLAGAAALGLAAFAFLTIFNVALLMWTAVHSFAQRKRTQPT